MRITSLLEKMERIDWQAIRPGGNLGNYNRLSPDKISVQYAKKEKDGKEMPMEVKIRIGNNVAEKLDFKHQDRICVFYDPDDIFIMMLAKVQTGGYKLTKEINGNAYRLCFKWQNAVPLEEMKPTEVEFEVSNRRLIFEARPPRRILHSFNSHYDNR